MQDRLTKLISSEGITPAKLAEIINVQRSAVSHILTGRNKPSYDLIERILTKFPKLSAEWLIMGRGEMYKTTIQQRLFDEVTYVNNAKVESLDIEIPKTTDKSDPIVSKLLDEKNDDSSIEKIVLFFRDKSFSIYQPK